MSHKLLTTTALALLAFISAAIAQPAQSPFSTRKIDGTDNVYLFRYQGHQSMFIVTPKGVIATDPIGRYRPEAVTAYLAEIKKVTDQPVKYLVYSHAHFDHIAGGKPFKDQGAIVVAHKNAKTHFEWAKKQGALLDSVVLPDQVVDNKKVISLGGTTLEDPALSQKRHLIGDDARKSHFVSHQDEVLPFTAQLPDHVEHLGSHFRVQR